MTDAELKEYYADLLIVQYVGQTRARETIKTLAGLAIINQLPVAVMNAYSLETAVGDQLDILGKYIGGARTNYTTDGYITLNDDDFRQLLKLLMIKNNSGSSLNDIQNLLAVNFPNLIRIADTQAMLLNYVIAEDFGSPNLLSILTDGRYLPAPMGVQTSVVIVPDINVAYFGFRTYSSAGVNISPFNFYAFYNTAYTWLSYDTDISGNYLATESDDAILTESGDELEI